MALYSHSPLNQMYRYMSMLVNANSCEWIVLNGHLDIKRLRRAARAVARRHWVLNSFQRRKGLGFAWETWSDEAEMDIRYERLPPMSDEERHQHLVHNIWQEQLPLTQGRPWRIHVSEDDNGRTWLQVITTHVFTDGRSANIVARDLAHAYTAAEGDNIPELDPEAPRDPERDPFKLFTQDLSTADKRGLVGDALKAIVSDATAPCDRLALKKGPVGKTGVLFFDFGADTWQRVRRAGKHVGLSVHPFLLGAVLRSIQRWNQKRGKQTRILRVIDNFTLRRFNQEPHVQDIYDVFAIPYSLDYQLDQDDKSLLKQIKTKLDVLKKGAIRKELYRQWLYMSSSLLSPKVLATRLLIKFVVRSNIICTNIGPVPEDFDRFGDASVDEYYSFSQMFPPGEMMFLFSTYRGSLRTVLLYDTNKITQQEAQQFVDDTYTDELLRLTEDGAQASLSVVDEGKEKSVEALS